MILDKIAEINGSINGVVWGIFGLALLIGTNLNAVGDATVSISTNSVNLTTFVVNCTTANGTMTVRSSFTYNPQELFPEVEDETTEDTTEDENNENTETAE